MGYGMAGATADLYEEFLAAERPTVRDRKSVV